MDVLEAIRRRREITRFQDQPVEEAALEAVIEAGYLAPAGNHLVSRELIVVRDPDVLRVLAQTTPYMPWLSQAPAGIAVTGLPGVSKYWLQDASIACGFMWLAAVEQGLGLAFGAVYHSEDAEESARREEHVRRTLGIPADRRVVAILGIGYPASEPGVKELHDKGRVVYEGRFGFPWKAKTPVENT
ncbi:MAG: nitroreductase family protein [Alicyclobacillaceae bacterium]|nr:nitroreductase family protein [Alicyclobacillaceae bacterium]